MFHIYVVSDSARCGMEAPSQRSCPRRGDVWSLVFLATSHGYLPQRL